MGPDVWPEYDLFVAWFWLGFGLDLDSLGVEYGVVLCLGGGMFV